MTVKSSRFRTVGFRKVDADDQSDYAPRYPQPQRKRARDYGRYEYEPPSLQHRQEALKAQRIHVFTNGGQYEGESGLHFSFSRKQFPRFESLLEFVNSRIRTKIAVRFLYRWPACEEIKVLEDIEEDDRIFVASDCRKIYKRRNYAGIPFGGDRYGGDQTAFSEKYSRGSHESRSTIRSKPSPVSHRSNNSIMTSGRAPIMINLISNMDRGSKQSMIINPQSGNFEDILKTVEEIINIDRPPVTALYTLRPPHKKVDSFSTLTKVVRQYGDTFYACGQEGPPEEIFMNRSPNQSPNRSPNRETSPMRNGYQYQTPRGRQQNGHQEYKDESRGRQYNFNERQREQARNQPDGEDGSPTRARDRRNPPGNNTHRSKQTPRRSTDDSRTPRKASETRKQNGHRDDGESDNSRSNSPTDEVMSKRIEDMDTVKDNLDDDIEF